MKALSEQLNELSDRVKKAEDFVTMARAKNRAALDSQRELLKSSIGESKAKAEASAAATQSRVQSWWDDTRSSVDGQFAALRARLDERRAEHDVRQADRRANDAEQDAVYAVEFAISMLDQAEYAVADDRAITIDTARVWIASAGSTSTAATRLHLHRNTVRYRLRRLEELTDRSLANPLDLAELHVALECARMLGVA